MSEKDIPILDRYITLYSFENNVLTRTDCSVYTVMDSMTKLDFALKYLKGVSILEKYGRAMSDVELEAYKLLSKL